ncbi:oligopeptide ABC transporter ATP-binding protein [Tepiditoga spiralis]|uniref:Oligopeptide ABC transporter ATP-binding protein n=1 Tax=Tepiditoga spiralis TaxID=2108365 RepID=A0A7G1G674_9BACT|nr:ABC transporter ATP-binding protein [Tepiditoga spiralis]BBE31665.1 oligopeptide ABC transporter ATP-binding protein [Tepiditoga spiralis]
MNEVILEVKNLCKDFTLGVFSKEVKSAVKNVSFEVKKGEIISLIGESGSGKTTIGRMILKLLKPSKGKIIFKDKDITEIKSKKEKKDYYLKVQGIFQDPFSSFNSLYKVDRIFNMIFNSYFPHEEKKDGKIKKALNDVGLKPESVLNKYPHQLSGGQLQRLLIARALLMNVDLLIADELISMLDASTRIGVLNLLGKLSKENGMSVIFITHDLSLGYYLSDTTLIMYKGKLVEKGSTEKIYKNPVHPYTKMLLNSIPDIGFKWKKEEKFLPEKIEIEVNNFYKKNINKDTELEVEKNHKVIVNGR